MSNPLHIFDVGEVTGKEHSALETTAAEARIEAPDAVAAHEVDVNAEKAHDAAEHAASFAKTMGSKYTGEPTTAADKFRGDASRTTNAAVAEGKKDVDKAKDAGAGFVQEVKDYAKCTIETVQGYLPTAIGGKSAESPAASTRSKTEGNNTGTGVVESVQATATSAYTAAKEAVQPHIEKVQGVAQDYLGMAGTQGAHVAKPTPASSMGISATSAPLESDPHTVDTSCPPKDSKVSGIDIAASGSSPSAATRN
jgi:hypothetical protein